MLLERNTDLSQNEKGMPLLFHVLYWWQYGTETGLVA